jgi:tetratricopeptide (TPR) repeat protein
MLNSKTRRGVMLQIGKDVFLLEREILSKKTLIAGYLNASCLCVLKNITGCEEKIGALSEKFGEYIYGQCRESDQSFLIVEWTCADRVLSAWLALFAATHPQYAATLNDLALRCIDKGDHAMALAKCQDSLDNQDQKHEARPTTMRIMARAQLMAKNWTECKRLCFQILKEEAQNPAERATTLTLLAEMFCKNGDATNGLKTIEMAEENLRKMHADEQHEALLLELAHLCLTIRANEKAIRLCERAPVAKSNNDVDLLYILGCAHYKTNNFLEALPLLEACVSKEEEDSVFIDITRYVSALKTICLIYYSMKNLTSAIEAQQKVVNLQGNLGDPDLADSILRLAELHWKSALHYFRLAKEHYPEGDPHIAMCESKINKFQ